MKQEKNKLIELIRNATKDDNFLYWIHWVENFVAKILSLALSIVILVAVFDLVVFLFKDISKNPTGFYNKGLIQLFGLFLNILIALELLENITAYLKKHIVQVELVIVTSLIAVARKIIIFDLQKYSNTDLVALGVAILSLAISYWLVKRLNYQNK
jgi:uncharacterized membrane protein (DUF373 family)